MIAKIQGTGAGFATGTDHTLAFGSSLTAGNLVVVAIGISQLGAATYTVTDTLGNTYIQVGANVTNGNTKCALWYAKNITGGASTVNVKTSTSKKLAFSIAEYSGCDTAAPLDGSSSGTGTSNAPSSGTVTVSQGGTLVCGAFSVDNATNATITAGATFSKIFSNPGTAGECFGSEDDSASLANTNIAASWTINIATSIWAAIGASFKPVSGAVAAQQQLSLLGVGA